MINEQTVFTLINPQNGSLALKLFLFEDNSYFDHLQRNNYYSLIWVTAGNGKVKADFSEFAFSENLLFAFSPYQPFMFTTDEKIKGFVVQFHPDFYCIIKHQKEVACNGVLFNNIYEPPFTFTDEQSADTFSMLIGQMKAEMRHAALGAA